MPRKIDQGSRHPGLPLACRETKTLAARCMQLQIEQSVEMESYARSTTSYLDLLRDAKTASALSSPSSLPVEPNGTALASSRWFFATSQYDRHHRYIRRRSSTASSRSSTGSRRFAGGLMVDIVLADAPCSPVAGMFVSYVIWTVLTAFTHEQGINHMAGNAVVAFIFIYYFFYDIAWSLLLAYPVEIFEYGLRARGVAVTYGSTFIGSHIRS